MSKLILPGITSFLLSTTLATAGGEKEDYTRIINYWHPDSIRVKGYLDPKETLLESLVEDLQRVNNSLKKYNVFLCIPVRLLKGFVRFDEDGRTYQWQACNTLSKQPVPPKIPKKPVAPPETLTQVIKQIIQFVPAYTPVLPLKIKPNIVPDSIDLYIKPIIVEDTVKKVPQPTPQPTPPSPPVLPIVSENKGLYDLDESNAGIGVIYRKDNGEFFGINPFFSVHSYGNALRGKIALDYTLLNDLKTEEKNNILKGILGLYNEWIGVGSILERDAGEKTFLGYYLVGALPLGEVILSGAGGHVFRLNEENEIRHFFEAALNYKKNKFGFNIGARSGQDILLNQYLNSLNLGLKFLPLFVGLEVKSPYGMNIVDARVEDVANSIEAGLNFGFETKLDNSKGYVSAGINGRHREEGKYEILQFGIEAGLNW